MPNFAHKEELTFCCKQTLEEFGCIIGWIIK